jgi:tetratricopeptide (TPR) repeat protein
MRHALLIAAAWIASACASPGTRPAPVLVEDGAGFTITERARVGAGVRGDFEDALRLLEQDRYEDGIALLIEVTGAAPGLTAPHIDLAIAYARLDRLAEAEQSLAKAIELDPSHPVALNELGLVYRRTGRFADARRSYEAALARYPGFHFARRNLAILCDVYLADPACALEHYEAYTRSVPGDQTAAMWLADLRARAER